MADYEMFSFIYEKPQVAGVIALVCPDRKVRTFTRSEMIALIDAGDNVTNNHYKLSVCDDKGAAIRWVTANPAGLAGEDQLVWPRP